MDTINQDTILKNEWKNQQLIMQKVYDLGFANFAKSIPQIQKAFTLKDRSLRCIDEGTPGGIHLAGSGILFNLNKEKLKRFVSVAKVDGVYSHKNCGACKLYARMNNLASSDYDNLGIVWAKELAAQLNVPYKGHINEDLKRPKEFHNARVVYYDGTGSFDYSQVNQLPPGFIISRRYLDLEYALKELEIAIDIAFGNNGFGERFTVNTPLIIAPIGDSKNKRFSVKTLKAEINNFIAKYGNRIIIDSF